MLVKMDSEFSDVAKFAEKFPDILVWNSIVQIANVKSGSWAHSSLGPFLDHSSPWTSAKSSAIIPIAAKAATSVRVSSTTSSPATSASSRESDSFVFDVGVETSIHILDSYRVGWQVKSNQLSEKKP